MHAAADIALDWVERGIMPDRLVRAGIRRLCEERLHAIAAADCEGAADHAARFVSEMDVAPIAPLPALANEQHYEVPPEFFELVLGARRKYSSAWWPTGVETLDGAEHAALETTCMRAGLCDGQRVLELGCGWGSLTLWMAEHYPGSRITGVSNSRSQREWILGEAARLGLSNIEVITADMNRFEIARRFDRIVSVEMFEHMRNWRRLFGKVHDWLHPGGRFFMHVFCHTKVPYAFVDNGPDDWMGRHFFSGGMMPCDDLPLYFQESLRFVRRWRWDGRHYERTANAWLENLDAHREPALRVLVQVHGEREAPLWLQRWRVFFMACAELFGFRDGQEWGVGHYLFERPGPGCSEAC